MTNLLDEIIHLVSRTDHINTLSKSGQVNEFYVFDGHLRRAGGHSPLYSSVYASGNRVMFYDAIQEVLVEVVFNNRHVPPSRYVGWTELTSKDELQEIYEFLTSGVEER